MRYLKGLSFILFVIGMLYFLIAAAVFQIRNPKANEMQIYVYFYEVVTFKKIEEFQK